MLDLVNNPEDRFSGVTAHIMVVGIFSFFFLHSNKKDSFGSISYSMHTLMVLCIEVKHPIQQFFSHVGMEPPLHGY